MPEDEPRLVFILADLFSTGEMLKNALEHLDLDFALSISSKDSFPFEQIKNQESGILVVICAEPETKKRAFAGLKEQELIPSVVFLVEEGEQGDNESTRILVEQLKKQSKVRAGAVDIGDLIRVMIKIKKIRSNGNSIKKH